MWAKATQPICGLRLVDPPKKNAWFLSCLVLYVCISKGFSLLFAVNFNILDFFCLNYFASFLYQFLRVSFSLFLVIMFFGLELKCVKCIIVETGFYIDSLQALGHHQGGVREILLGELMNFFFFLRGLKCNIFIPN